MNNSTSQKKEGFLSKPINLTGVKLVSQEKREELLQIIKGGTTINRETLKFVTKEEKAGKPIYFMLKDGDAIGVAFGNAILRILSEKTNSLEREKTFASRRTLPLKARTKNGSKIFIATKLGEKLVEFHGDNSMFNENLDIAGKDKKFAENCARLWGVKTCVSSTDFNARNTLRSAVTGRPVEIDVDPLGNHIFGYGVLKPFGSSFTNDFLRKVLADEDKDFVEKTVEDRIAVILKNFGVETIAQATEKLAAMEAEYEALRTKSWATITDMKAAKEELDEARKFYQNIHNAFVESYQEGIDNALLEKIKKNINKEGNEHLKDLYIEFIHGLQDAIELASDKEFFDAYCLKFKDEFGQEAFEKVTTLRRFYEENAVTAAKQFESFIEYCKVLESEKSYESDGFEEFDSASETNEVARTNDDSGISSSSETDSQSSASEDEEERAESIVATPKVAPAEKTNELKNYIEKFNANNIKLIDLNTIDKLLQQGFDVNAKINNLSLLEYVSALAFNKGNYIDKAATIVAKLIKSGAEIDQKILSDKNFAKVFSVKFKTAEVNDIKQQIAKNGKAVFKEIVAEKKPVVAAKNNGAIAITKKVAASSAAKKAFATLTKAALPSAANKPQQVVANSNIKPALQKPAPTYTARFLATKALEKKKPTIVANNKPQQTNVTKFQSVEQKSSKPFISSAPALKTTIAPKAPTLTAAPAELTILAPKPRPNFEEKFQETAKSFALRKTEKETFATLNSALKKISKYSKQGTASSILRIVWPENSQQKGENVLTKSEMEVLTNFAKQISLSSGGWKLEGKMKSENDTLNYAQKQLVLQPILNELKKGDLPKWLNEKNKQQQESAPSSNPLGSTASKLSGQNQQMQHN